jgi:hypothetical protein
MQSHLLTTLLLIFRLFLFPLLLNFVCLLVDHLKYSLCNLLLPPIRHDDGKSR